jgi:hypothetical protein
MSKINIDELLKILPKLIRENDTVKGAIISALSGVVATHDDIVELTKSMNERFESMDKRFESMDKRFESMDKKFESIQRSMNERFESIQRSMNERFESMDKKFESIQRSMDRRFESIDKRFESVQQSMDRRFESLIKQMNKGFELAGKERKKMETRLLSISSRSGEKLEDLVLNLLSDKLIQENIERKDISRKELIDREGHVFFKDYRTDVDVVIRNGKTLLMEIKSTADNRDVFFLMKKGELFKELYKKEYDGLILACLEINRTNFEYAVTQGIHVITAKIT